MRRSHFPFRADPHSILWHYANGRLPMWIDGPGSPIGWVSYSHRGVVLLDQLHIGESQQRAIGNRAFDFRINTAFKQVIEGCAAARPGQTWITDDVLYAYERLHRLGYAHSFEIWKENQLAGGLYMVQINGYVTIESMFHTVSNAGKAAQVRTMMHLRDRGFKFVDTNGVPTHFARSGATWLPHWRFMELLKQAIGQRVSVADNCPAQPLPRSIRLALPASNIAQKIGKRLKLWRGLQFVVQNEARVEKNPEPLSIAPPPISPPPTPSLLSLAAPSSEAVPPASAVG